MAITFTAWQRLLSYPCTYSEQRGKRPELAVIYGVPQHGLTCSHLNVTAQVHRPLVYVVREDGPRSTFWTVRRCDKTLGFTDQKKKRKKQMLTSVLRCFTNIHCLWATSARCAQYALTLLAWRRMFQQRVSDTQTWVIFALRGKVRGILVFVAST